MIGTDARHEVAVIGAGFSGIGAAIKLDQTGFGDFVIFEQGDGVGGAWHWNTYPGVAVDIPSSSYQFSFEQRSDWSRVYAPGAELKAYAEHCVDAYGLRSRIRLNTTVTAATFDEQRHVWRLATADGEEVAARFIVGATGILTQPSAPEIPGLETFSGTVMHTARWNHDVDLRGRRVGIIGTGASAVQVIPSIAAEVARLVVFQRTPIWCLPKADAAIAPVVGRALGRLPGAKYLARAVGQTFVELTFPLPAHFHGVVPIATAGERVGRGHLRRQVHDPRLRDALTPRYALGCKRPSFSNEYLPTFNRTNVLLETAGIAAVTPAGVQTVGRAPLPGLRGCQRPRLPEPLPNPRSLWLQRRQLLHADREPDAPHRALPAPSPPGRRDGRRDQRPRQPALLRGHARAAPAPGLLPGLLRDGQQLLLRPPRRRAVPLRVDPRGRLAQREVRPRRLPVQHGRRGLTRARTHRRAAGVHARLGRDEWRSAPTACVVNSPQVAWSVIGAARPDAARDPTLTRPSPERRRAPSTRGPSRTSAAWNRGWLMLRRKGLGPAPASTVSRRGLR